ncbi:MAG TPA: PTS sugar transporter subunit IIA [Xanthobacteraceae bacterium]|nr:PTS sugar transporter subunit IIA [Xanthobacteraceae bacterium]
MEIKDFLSPTDALINMRVSDKTRLLHELAARAAASLNLAADRISVELLKREHLGSTGTGGGVAIPHARIPDLKKPFGILVRLRNPIDFEAIDGKPVDVIFLLLLPAQSQGDSLNALASIARRLRDPESLQRLRSAADAAGLYSAMLTEPRR